jgi:hypothetical protein
MFVMGMQLFFGAVAGWFLLTVLVLVLAMIGHAIDGY